MPLHPAVGVSTTCSPPAGVLTSLFTPGGGVDILLTPVGGIDNPAQSPAVLNHYTTSRSDSFHWCPRASG